MEPLSTAALAAGLLASEEAATSKIELSFMARNEVSAPIYGVNTINLSFSPEPFISSNSFLALGRFSFSPSYLDLELSFPAVEALAVQPRSFAPIPALPSKPVLKLQPKPSKLPKRSPVVQPPRPELQAVITPPTVPLTAHLTEKDIAAAQTAWQFIKRNWNPATGLVNAVEYYPWTTLWDQGSAILGIHAARQLNLIAPAEFDTLIAPLLRTLKTLPLAPTGLPNKAYSTRTAQMRTLDNAPDPQGTSGWSVLDTSRLLLSLDVLRTHYPNYRALITQIVQGWKVSQLVKNGWLQGGIPQGQQILKVQEGRLGYEQYAAQSLKLWQLQAPHALSHPPVTTLKIEGVSLNIDRRNLKNSGASNPLTSDPYVMWGLELGWPKDVTQQASNLLTVQRKYYERTGILTAVNEDSLDRPPYFMYGSVYADGKPWTTKDSAGKDIDRLQHLSVKAAFGWEALLPKEPYAKLLRNAVQSLAHKTQGYFTGQFKNQSLGVNTVLNVNTNAVVLESVLYRARNGKPLILP